MTSAIATRDDVLAELFKPVQPDKLADLFAAYDRDLAARLLSVAEAEGRRIGWPGPRGAAFPVDAAGRLYDDRCLNHERIDPATCPICHGTHVRPVDMFFG